MQRKEHKKKKRKENQKKRKEKIQKLKKKKNKARKVENPQRAPWQKLEPKKVRLILECTLTPNYVRLDSHLWDT